MELLGSGVDRGRDWLPEGKELMAPDYVGVWVELDTYEEHVAGFIDGCFDGRVHVEMPHLGGFFMVTGLDVAPN